MATTGPSSPHRCTQGETGCEPGSGPATYLKDLEPSDERQRPLKMTMSY